MHSSPHGHMDGVPLDAANKLARCSPAWAEWVLMTAAFEFLAGHYVFGTSWARLLADYDVSRGRIWILVLATMAFAPALVVHLRSLLAEPS